MIVPLRHSLYPRYDSIIKGYEYILVKLYLEQRDSIGDRSVLFVDSLYFL